VIEGLEALFYRGEIDFPQRGGDSQGLVPIQEFKGGVLSIGVVLGVVGEFYKGERIRPGFRIYGTEDQEICFDFLIDPFGSSVCLGVDSDHHRFPTGSGTATCTCTRISRVS
jgi:hypothetical protein